jgi:hypothetical protein
MRKSLAFMTFLLSISLSFWSTITWAFTPTWQLAEEWQVKVAYPVAGKSGTWTAPIVWHYRVATLDQDNITLAVSRAGTEPEATLRYRRADMSLVEIQYVKQLRGARKSFTESFASGLPVASEAFLAPYDTPIFPLQAPDRQEYAFTQSVAGLKTVGTIVQEVVSTSTLPADAGATDDGSFLKVSCSRNRTMLFELYWQTGQPWPTYGENRNMRYWLVHHE